MWTFKQSGVVLVIRKFSLRDRHPSPLNHFYTPPPPPPTKKEQTEKLDFWQILARNLQTMKTNQQKIIGFFENNTNSSSIPTRATTSLVHCSSSSFDRRFCACIPFLKQNLLTDLKLRPLLPGYASFNNKLTSECVFR